MASVIVAMSGGVDSSVAAALITGAGHQALGVTLKSGAHEAAGQDYRGSDSSIADAQEACDERVLRRSE